MQVAMSKGLYFCANKLQRTHYFVSQRFITAACVAALIQRNSRIDLREQETNYQDVIDPEQRLSFYRSYIIV